MTKEDVIEILEKFVIGAKPCSQREIVDACASAYRMLKEQPSLPSNLDEAAETHRRKVYCGDPGESQLLRETFKAGAEWMAGQGISMEITDDTKWEEVDSFVHRNLDGANVIQIRKK